MAVFPLKWKEGISTEDREIFLFNCLVLVFPFISLSSHSGLSNERPYHSCCNVSHTCRKGRRSSHCTRNGMGCEKWSRAAFLATQKNPECFEQVFGQLMWKYEVNLCSLPALSKADFRCLLPPKPMGVVLTMNFTFKILISVHFPFSRLSFCDQRGNAERNRCWWIYRARRVLWEYVRDKVGQVSLPVPEGLRLDGRSIPIHTILGL